MNTLFIQYILLFLYFFNFVPAGFNLSIRNIYAVLGFLLFCVNIFNHRIKYNKNIIKIFFLYILFIFAVYSTIIINSTYQTIAITFFIYRFFVLFFAAIFISYVVKNLSTEKLLDMIVVCYVIQCFITLGSFFVHPFGDFIYSIQTDVKDFYRYVRAIGLGFGFDSGAMELSLVMLILLYKILNKNNSSNYVLLLFLMTLTGLLVARTTFIGICFLFLFYCIYYNKTEHKIVKHNKLKLFFYFLCFIFVLIMLLIALYQKYQNVIDWMLQMFKKKNFSSQISSLDILFGKMYFNLDGFTLFFGDGKFTENGKADGMYYKGTDAGYMRLLLLGGIPLLLIYLMIEVTYFIGLSKKYNKYKYLWFVFLLADFVYFMKIIVFPVAPIALLMLNRKNFGNNKNLL